MATYSSPYHVPADSTAVVGRRIGAWVIDLIIYLLLSFLVTAAFGGFSFETWEDLGSEAAAERFCDIWEEENPGGVCFPSTDSAITYEGSSASLVFWAIHLVAYGVISGMLGGSPGKLAVGLRVVGADGQKAGIGKNLLRTVLWIVDAITCAVPIVGGILMVSTKGHRRVGDMAAGTFVVDKDAVGQPVNVPGLTGSPGYAPTYGAPAGWGTGPAAPGTGWGTGPASSPAPGGWAPPATGADAPFGSPAAPGPAAPGPTPGADAPTWDPARNAYIQYDRELASWMQWDDASNQWKPISQ